MSNDEFIQQHLQDDTRALALKRMPEGVDAAWCLQQIEGWQLARKKLPQWAATQGLWFPPRLSMEQCSSELTATYKHHLVTRLLPTPADRGLMIDLTGGFGVDFSYIAPAFQRPIYVERQEALCNVARHNLPLLNLPQAEVICADTQTSADLLAQTYDLAFIDPARRDNIGRKVVGISDCTPDLTMLQDHIKARYLMVKLSPMLDITQALRDLHSVCEVHVISVAGECKELLLVIKGHTNQTADIDPTATNIDPEATAGRAQHPADPAACTIHCVNLNTADPEFSTSANEIRHTQPTIAPQPLSYLYEPNASILKGGAQDVLCHKLGLSKLHPMSNLYVSENQATDYPGRTFCIEAWSDFGKKSLRTLLADTPQANLTIRNFPATVAELRKKLKLREGGATYLFATTLSDGTHALIKCRKATQNTQNSL